MLDINDSLNSLEREKTLSIHSQLYAQNCSSATAETELTVFHTTKVYTRNILIQKARRIYLHVRN
jgi:hypothetical protein